ncbi:MAG: flagellar motor protein MotB [Planctomycetaceae bacterium]
MARKKKAPPSGPNMGYLISFGDTMTALLAFFIVLNSLAREQTGVYLYAGTGSFIEVSKGMGVPGLFALGTSTYPIKMDQPSPMYIVPGEEESKEVEHVAKGPDKDGEASFVRDREQDDLERFLLSMEQQHQVTEQQKVIGQVAFDRMPALPHEGNPIDAGMQQQLLQFAPILRRGGYELEIRIWSTTPGPSAWQRAAQQAQVIRENAIGFLKLPEDQSAMITATSSPWHSSHMQRPSVSFLLRRVGR